MNAFNARPEKKSYAAGYGCAMTISSETMDFFRSATLGFYDAADDSGIRNFGGMKPGCGFSGGLLPALGLLISSEASSGCGCSYNLKCSLALCSAERRSNEDWAFHNSETEVASPLSRTALNLAAPGDRRDREGLLWLGFPRPWSEKPHAPWQKGGAHMMGVPLHLEGYPGRRSLSGQRRPHTYRRNRTSVDLRFRLPRTEACRY